VKSVRDIFDAAMELTPDLRAAYIDQSCAGDDLVRARVQRLLSAHASANGFLSDVAVEAPAALEKPAAVGPYSVIEQLGEGGFGTVYLAEQSGPIRRQVALKIIKPGMDTRRVISRFESERQALALMDHPGIARVYDAGATDSGRPYFAMEVVRGEPLTDYSARAGLPLNQRLVLFQQVCNAVQHAHQKGIIHRDLKPANVLVTTVDGQPVPKIIDFGIAKATEAATDFITQTAATADHPHLLGTPQYMSPEQAGAGSGSGIDTRSDVYSLGVILYELLAGAPPFDPARLRSLPLAEVLRIIREEEPPRPSAQARRRAGPEE
jgi:eukaryotic-like serine/threonine-protein kinase